MLSILQLASDKHKYKLLAHKCHVTLSDSTVVGTKYMLKKYFSLISLGGE